MNKRNVEYRISDVFIVRRMTKIAVMKKIHDCDLSIYYKALIMRRMRSLVSISQLEITRAISLSRANEVFSY